MILLLIAHAAHSGSPIWPLFFWLGLLCLFFYGLPRLSGWHLLASRFRATEPWTGQKWSWQSARFRGWFGYNNSLVVGADPQSLSISMMRIFRPPFHPPLLIPWHEIEVETKKTLFGRYEMATLRLGSQERVTLRIYGKLVDRLRQASAAGWPLYQQEQMQMQGKPLYS